jgi:Domain of unknown function (DUF4383)
MAEAPLVRAMGSQARHRGDTADGTPAQWYCLLAGAALLVAGGVGFIADASFSVGSDVQGSDLVIFEVNAWHNIVHLATGALLVLAAIQRTSARTIALLFGITYGAVTVVGLITGDHVLGVIPVNGPDHVLHAALAIAGIVAAVISPRGEELATSTAPATLDAPITDREGVRRPDDIDPMTGGPRERERPTS